MGIINVLTYLKEELSDIPPVVKNIHNTDFEALFNILKSQKLHGGSYNIKLNITKGDDQELCTTRNSHKLSSKEKRCLSPTADGGIRIELFTDRILAAHRGTKLRPIAELTIQAKKFLKLEKDEFKEEWRMNPPYLVDKNHKYNTKAGVEWVEDLYRANPGLSKARKLKLIYSVHSYNQAAASYYDGLKDREREERFILKSSIPVNPKFMKIVIEKDVDGIDHFDMDFIHKNASEYLQLIKKNENLFEKNENYKEFVGFLNWFLKATTKENKNDQNR